MPFPTHDQIELPLLELLQEVGPITAKRAAEILADRLKVDQSDRDAETVAAWGRANLWRRRVRWAKQSSVERGLIESGPGGLWSLTAKADDKLRRCRPGVCIVVYETALGQALWAEAETALGVIEDKSVQLVFTSPPYPLFNKKEYGNMNGDQYLNWLSRLFLDAKRVMKDDGSLVINLMDCQAQPGIPSLSLYKEKLLIRLVEECGYSLIQNFFWKNPNKIPAGDWVTVRRQRVTNAIEHLFWLSPSALPKVRQKSVLTPYSERMKDIIAKGGEFRQARPNGHGMTQGGFGRDNGGAIPTNVITATNASSNDEYQRFCRRNNLPIHPARFPSALPEFFIPFLTDPGDLVVDVFGGSNTTGCVAEKLGRQWLTCDSALTYLAGSLGRFPGLPETDLNWFGAGKFVAA